jgi:hypothetical protein
MRSTSLAVGALLWGGATALLIEDAWRSGHVSVQHLLMPCLTAGTVVAAVQFHHQLSSRRWMSALAFLALAALGSISTVYSTLGRTAEAHDVRAASAAAANRTLALRQQSLSSAKKELALAEAEVARECRGGFGKNCAGWRATASERRSAADRIEAELASMAAAPADARADAAVRLGKLLGASDEAWLRSLLEALDPVLLPLFLEFGSIVFFAAGWPAAKPRETVSGDEETVEGPWSQDEALDDLRAMTRRGVSMDQRFLAARWGRSKATISRWMSQWHAEGRVHRVRDGKSKVAEAK